MDIRPDRLAHDIEKIASFSEESPEHGYSRPTFSVAWRQARDYVTAEAERAGCGVRVDAAGNVHARPAAIGWDAPVWLSGSHIDSVPTGGKYDGVVGVVAALEVLRAAPASPLELIIFAEEEGTTFNLGMLGSRAWVGTLPAAELATLRNQHGQDYFAAGAPHGVRRDQLPQAQLNPVHYRGLIELHVEQGLSMWNANIPVAVVTGINGRRQFICDMRGAANHAGSTTMRDRRDALAGAAEAIVELERLGRHLDQELPHTVITVGRVQVEPNAINVIAGSVTFSVDLRARSDAMLERGEHDIHAVIESVHRARGLSANVTRTETLPAVPLNAALCQRLRDAAQRAGQPDIPDVVSGALHDAAILSPHLPTAMLFIASEGGISHNPAEFSRIEDITLATRILGEAVNA